MILVEAKALLELTAITVFIQVLHELDNPDLLIETQSASHFNGGVTCSEICHRTVSIADCCDMVLHWGCDDSVSFWQWSL
ncbi:hypothetical protein CROQUDRAFT_91355 [Cronartium quercuum f. sp. fusiforme G11]|uniref:Uncharacterized protein n=1 Tax=Cronartium quercuum f. sp. fusiforme G11 TaxID=708437 RepID=A0A9P6TD95_9BASI|nr:hypothetical protein CROQUDRAFT_91355 [Cronartium quercuum f. sp. fusiforme G11]